MTASNWALANLLLHSDAQPAFVTRGDGQLQWGPGGSTATDTTLARTGTKQQLNAHWWTNSDWLLSLEALPAINLGAICSGTDAYDALQAHV